MRLDDVDRHTYLAARERASDDLVGCYRLDTGYDVTAHANLLPDFEAYAASGARLVDVGAYIACPERRKFRIFEALFTLLLAFMSRNEQDGIYIQVQPRQIGTYAAMGFTVASAPFRVVGWRPQWVAMYLDVPTLVRNHADHTFARDWARRHARPLDVPLWKRMCGQLRHWA